MTYFFVLVHLIHVVQRLRISDEWFWNRNRTEVVEFDAVHVYIVIVLVVLVRVVDGFDDFVIVVVVVIVVVG